MDLRCCLFYSSFLIVHAETTDTLSHPCCVVFQGKVCSSRCAAAGGSEHLADSIVPLTSTVVYPAGGPPQDDPGFRPLNAGRFSPEVVHVTSRLGEVEAPAGVCPQLAKQKQPSVRTRQMTFNPPLHGSAVGRGSRVGGKRILVRFEKRNVISDARKHSSSFAYRTVALKSSLM